MAFNEQRGRTGLKSVFGLRAGRAVLLTTQFSVIALFCFLTVAIVTHFLGQNNMVRLGGATEAVTVEKSDLNDVQTIVLSPDIDRRAAVLIASEDRRSFRVFIDNFPLDSGERAVLWAAPRAGTTIPIGVFKNGDTLALPETLNFMGSRYYISIEPDDNFVEYGMRGRITLQGQMQ